MNNKDEEFLRQICQTLKDNDYDVFERIVLGREQVSKAIWVFYDYKAEKSHSDKFRQLTREGFFMEVQGGFILTDKAKHIGNAQKVIHL